jgi:ligand-binding sensor domain-containing protein
LLTPFKFRQLINLVALRLQMAKQRITTYLYLEKRLICFLIFFISIVLYPLSSLSQQPVLKNFNVRDGLPSFETYCATQDSKGFIWFGTDGGVSCFNGYTFKNYTIENGLADNTVFGIYEDRHGRIWFRSLSGKLCYWHNDSIYSIGANDSILHNIRNCIMSTFYIDSGDTIWCGIRGGTCYFKINPGYKGSDFHCIVPKIKTGYIIKIEKGHFISGNIIEPHQPDREVIYNKQQVKQVIPLKFSTPYKDSLALKSLIIGYIYFAEDTNNTFYAYTGNDILKLDTSGMEPLYNTKPIVGRATCFVKDKNNLWLSVYHQGLFNVHITNGKITPGNIHILNGYSISNVMTDNEGGLWITTLENGVYYLAPSHFLREYELPIGQSVIYYTLSKLDNNHMAISHAKDTVDLVSQDTTIKNISLHAANGFSTLLSHTNITYPVIIKTGNLYSDNSFMAYILFSKEGNPKPIVDENNNPLGCYLTAIDSVNKRAYILNRYFLYQISENNKDSIKIATLPSRTSSCHLDAEGYLWLACNNGLWAYHNGKMEYHGNDVPYLNERIEGIAHSTDGSYYFATYGNGVLVKKGNSVKRLTIANGLISNNCQDIFIDSYHTIWVGSKSGLSALVLDSDGNYSITKYNLIDAMPSQKIQQICQTGTKLWIASENTIISHTLPAIETKKAPSLFITSFTVNDVSFPAEKSAYLRYNQNQIKISFIGLSYNSFGKLEYRYRLSGLDTAWYSTQNPFVQYQFLPPGDYTFTVKAITAEGLENPGIVSLSFSIHKPIWLTAWFIILEVLLAGTIAFAFIQFRLRAIRKKEEEKTLINKRIADIEMKALRAQMNPHFIFNAINSIQNHILKNDSKTAQDYLARFARLIRNVMENSKSEDIPLGQELDTLKLYISLEQLRANGKFQFSISVADTVSLYNTMIPPLLLQPFVENAILHGLMPLQDKTGLLTLTIEEHTHQLICIIQDNGIGRKKAEEIKKNRAASHRSMGISATEDRINILNNLQPGMANITITDITEPHTGTIIKITIPLKIAQ